MEDFDLFYVFCVLIPLGLGALLFFLLKRKELLPISKKIFLISWNTLLTACLLSLVFLGGETWYRFGMDTTDAFGLNKLNSRWIDRHFKLNNFKARDNVSYQLAIPPGKRRLTFTGDSFTAGHGIRNVNDRFSNLIRRTNPDLDVHVMAANGLESIDELGLVKKLVGDGYQFDQVVLVYVFNDIAPFEPKTKDIYTRIESYEQESGFWIDNSYLINTLFYRRKMAADPEVSQYYRYLAKSYFAKPWEQQQEVLVQIKDVVEQAGGQLQVIGFPFLHDLSQAYTFRAAHHQMKTFWASLQVPYFDLLPVFEGKKKEDICVNKFDAHPNELANKMAAEALISYWRLNK